MQQQLLVKIHSLYPSKQLIVLSFQYPYINKEYYWKGIKVISFNGKNRSGIKRWRIRNQIYKIMDGLQASNQVMGILSFWHGECALVGHRYGQKNKIPSF
jgi:hypothetical protein